MPVLVNKGDQPTLAAWLFYSSRASVESLRDTIKDKGYQAGTIIVDVPDGKPRDAVPVHLAATTQLPEALAELQDDGTNDIGKADEANTDENAYDTQTTDQITDDDIKSAQDKLNDLDLTINPDDEGVDVFEIGTTTLEAAQHYLEPREVDDKPWTLNVPGLPQLADFIDQLLGAGQADKGFRWIIWSVDPSGIMRLTPAKDVKPMAGNILRVKL